MCAQCRRCPAPDGGSFSQSFRVSAYNLCVGWNYRRLDGIDRSTEKQAGIASIARVRRVIDRRRSPTLAFNIRFSAGNRSGRKMTGQRRSAMEALIVGLVSIAVIWLIVIYGSNYLNKNVQ